MDRKWKLGEDLYPEDSLLDGVTISDIILALHHSSEVNPHVAKKLLLEILETRLEDMWFIFNNNIDEIIEAALKGRNA